MALLDLKKQDESTSLTALWRIGLGRITATTLLKIGPPQRKTYGSLMGYVLLANTPQIIFSGLYLIYNSLYTSMLMEQEWQAFAHRRKPLRVSKPIEGQRSTYFLELPYKYSVPLMATCGLMHWLISQAIFLAHVVSYGVDGSRNPDDDILTCGYSPIGIIFSIVAGKTMVALLGLMSMRRYIPGLPLAKSRSSVISTVCKRLPADTSASSSRIKWGLAGTKDGVNQHVFSSYGVVPPIVDRGKP